MDEFHWWVAYAVCTCGAMYTHYTAVFVLVVQLVWALWTQPQARKYLVMANVAVVLAYIPWLNGLREDLHAPNFIGVAAPLKTHIILSILETTAIGHPLLNIGRLPGRFTAVLAGAGLVVGLIGLILKARTSTRLRWRPTSLTTLVVLLALAPACLELIYSWARASVFGGPFLIASWPGLALTIGVIVTRPSRPLWMVAAALTLGAYAIGGILMLGSAAQRPHADAVVAYINRVGTPGDPVVSLTYFANPYSEVDVALADDGQPTRYPVLRLGSPSLAEQLAPLSRPNPQPVFFGLPVIPPQQVAASAAASARHGTIFLISFSSSILPSNANAETRQFLQALPARFHVVTRINYPGLAGGYLMKLYVIRTTGSSH